ncbi:MAG: hypothetical protein DWQ02_12610 [Bacteroidetes bacterium]|nr:MAG: hypothetical protein DWQ02_12610 [Bacteroidota bacterium]
MINQEIAVILFLLGIFSYLLKIIFHYKYFDLKTGGGEFKLLPKAFSLNFWYLMIVIALPVITFDKKIVKTWKRYAILGNTFFVLMFVFIAVSVIINS